MRARFVVVKQAHSFAFEKTDAEAVGMVVGQTAAAAEAFNENTMSVGVLQFMPRSWHIIFFALNIVHVRINRIVREIRRF